MKKQKQKRINLTDDYLRYLEPINIEGRLNLVARIGGETVFGPCFFVLATSDLRLATRHTNNCNGAIKVLYVMNCFFIKTYLEGGYSGRQMIALLTFREFTENY